MADDLKPAYLVAGTDRPKIDRAVERLRARYSPDAVEIHSAAEMSGAEAVATCNALGLFATDGRLIVVERVESWKADDAKEVSAYLKAPAPATTLALVGGELKKDSPLAKAVLTGKGDVLLWDVPQRGLQKWVSEQFGVHNTKAEPEACRALLELVGDDLYDLSSEIDKLATWAAGEPITATDVERLVAARAETTNFALTDAWGARDLVGVLQASEGLLERSGDPRSRTIPRIAGILTGHVAKIRRAQALEAQGISAKDAAAQLRQHPYYVGKLYAQGRNYSPEELRTVTVRLADLDHALKGGSRVSGDLELERALSEITKHR
ncbi:MAG TPA: DNA polymerase III subunit delta [Gaiellaceae bacterium]|jgi:DNA polymerase-3 subunit delta